MKNHPEDNLLEAIQGVSPLPNGYRLHIIWADGFEAEVDLTEHIHRFAVAAPLRDPKRFAQAAIGPEDFTVDFGDDLEIPGDMLRAMALKEAGDHAF